jgi:hypothetical protein
MKQDPTAKDASEEGLNAMDITERSSSLMRVSSLPSSVDAFTKADWAAQARSRHKSHNLSGAVSRELILKVRCLRRAKKRQRATAIVLRAVKKSAGGKR